jgi:hypothetical protein
LALVDAFEAGKNKMVAMDYVNSRHRSRKRVKRERRVLQDALYFFVQKMGNDYSQVKAKMKTGSMDSTTVPEYRQLVNNL